MSFLHFLTDPVSIIQAAGLAGVFLIVFAESGLFFGFFLPGDSLLFTAGFLASQGAVSAPWLFLGVFIAAVLGDNVGYAFGKRVGPAFFTKDDSFFFNKKYPQQAEKFYHKHGTKTLIYARFVPVLRTFAPILAGVGAMDYRSFFLYNLAGGAAWTLLLTGAGFFLGNIIPGAGRYITSIVIIIIVVSCIPPAWHFIREKAKGKQSDI